MYSDDGTVYGIAIASTVGGTTTSCDKGTSRCIGSSVPGTDLEPYYTVTCDTSTYLGPNPYHFSPAQSTTGTYDQWTPIRSYVCDGMASTVRPTWKLMGYFPINAGCQALQGATYSETFCTVRIVVLSPSFQYHSSHIIITINGLSIIGDKPTNSITNNSSTYSITNNTITNTSTSKCKNV